MVGTQIKFSKILLALLVFGSFLSACHRKPKQGKTVFLQEAGYILEVNDTALFVRPDLLSRRLLPSTLTTALKHSGAPHFTVQWIYSSKSQVAVLAFLPPSDTLAQPGESKAGYQRQTYFAGGDPPVYRYVTDTLTLITTDADALHKFMRGGFVPMSPGLVQRIRNGRNSEAFANWYIQPAKILRPQDLPVQSGFLLRYNGKVWIWDVEAPGQNKYAGLGMETDSVHDLRDAFSVVDPGGKDLIRYLQNRKRFTAVFTESFPVWARHWAGFLASAGYARPPVPGKRYASVKALGFVQDHGPAILLWAERPDEVIGERDPDENIEGIDLYRNPDSTAFPAFLYPLAARKSLPWMAVRDQLVVMASDKQHLMHYLGQDVSDEMPGEIRDFLSTDVHLLHREGNRWFGIRYDDHLIFQNFAGITVETPAQATEKGARYTRLFDLQWPAGLGFGPQWIYNHRSRSYEILFQDKAKRLVLLDGKGKPRWQKNIDEPITGPLYQVDMFRNGKRQFLYATPSGVYVMDIRGTYVKPFPLHLQPTGPIGLFDYERKRHYRIAVPLGRRLALYDIQGRPVKGFSFNRLASPLQAPPQHLRIGGKDYLFVQQADGKLWVLNRRGQERIRVKKPVPSRDGIWKTYKGSFITVDTAGHVLQLRTSGKISKLFGGRKFKSVVIANEHIAATDRKGRVWIDGKRFKQLPTNLRPVQIFRAGSRIYFCLAGDGAGYLVTKSSILKLPFTPVACSPDARFILGKDGEGWTVFKLR